MKPSIRNRLLFILLSLTAATWIFTLWSSYQETQHEVSEIFDAQLAQSARSLLVLASHELQELTDLPANGNHVHFIPDYPRLNDGHPYEQKIAYQIWYLPKNTLMLRSANAPDHPLAAGDNGYSDQLINGEQWRIYTLTDLEGGYRVQMGESYTLRGHLIREIAHNLAMPNLLALPLLALLISFGIQRALQSLRTLTRAVAQRAPDTLEPVDEKDIPREIEPLVDELNKLFKRLEEEFEKERRFTADAAHELRTPLAALKVQAQVAQRAADPQQRQQALVNVVNGVDRATRLVEQLLTLARLDPERGISDLHRVELYPLAAEVLGDLASAAYARQIDLSLEGNETVAIEGQGDTLRMLITNLVDNALRYSPESGTVRVTLQDDSSGITLNVDDSGPGVSNEEQEQVFQRFYRGRDVTASGSGLGLSIVKRIADLHHATVALGRSDLGGLSVKVRFLPIHEH